MYDKLRNCFLISSLLALSQSVMAVSGSPPEEPCYRLLSGGVGKEVERLLDQLENHIRSAQLNTDSNQVEGLKIVSPETGLIPVSGVPYGVKTESQHDSALIETAYFDADSLSLSLQFVHNDKIACPSLRGAIWLAEPEVATKDGYQSFVHASNSSIGQGFAEPIAFAFTFIVPPVSGTNLHLNPAFYSDSSRYFFADAILDSYCRKKPWLGPAMINPDTDHVDDCQPLVVAKKPLAVVVN